MNERLLHQFSDIKTNPGQITFPLFDFQAVKKTFYVPFGGAGLFVKPTSGLLALKLLPYELKSYILEDFDLLTLKNLLE